MVCIGVCNAGFIDNAGKSSQIDAWMREREENGKKRNNETWRENERKRSREETEMETESVA